MESPILSVVIPAYNEEMVIAETLLQVNDFFLITFGKDYELILSDDGSTDRTVDIARSLEIPCLNICESPRNIGKGMAVKRGVMTAKGEYILFTDADLSSPIEEFEQLFVHKEKDIVIGSRALKASQVKTTLKKKILGRIGNLLISTLAVRGIKDTQCGFKLFKGPVAKHLFFLQRFNGWSFDFEILYLAQKYHYSIEEVPVKWIISNESKVKPTAYLHALIDLLLIRCFDYLGNYDLSRIPKQ